MNGRSLRAALLIAVVLGYPLPAIAEPVTGPRQEGTANGITGKPRDPVALAMRYESGLAVPRDYGRAWMLYCEAARRGDPRAFYSLGWMYLNGRGVARDDATAVMWLRKAADRGITQAANLLQLLPRVSPAPARDCPRPADMARQAIAKALPRASAPPEIRSLIEETAQHVGISARLLHSVVLVESGFDPRAVSPKMAAGLMQLMPATAERFQVRDSFDPRENVRAGATYLRLLIDKYKGDLTLALAAYNAGEGKVEAHGGVPPYEETRAYIAAVKRLCGCGE
jgi:soluble lytic murein transglycosylase-like protein